jgi:hypothetical protein
VRAHCLLAMYSSYWLVLGLAALGLSFMAWRAMRVWVDAGRRCLDPVRRIGWALIGAVAPSRYWWRARIEALSAQEQADLLVRETTALGLSHTDGQRCPLCGSEIPCAWTLAIDGHVTVAPRPVACPHCDFRLDSCRHCVHFLPGSAPPGTQFEAVTVDLTSGRCSRYRTSQPVEQVCQPDIARQLRDRGYEYVRGPQPILDSFFPLDFCTAFSPDRKRLKTSRVRWPDARRVALLGLLVSPPSLETDPPRESSTSDEQWLL